MSVASSRRIINRFIEDDGEVYAQFINEADSADSPSQTEMLDLASGNNSVTVPDDAIACTIIPPATNIDSDDPVNVQVDIILKGVNGDTGVMIHPTDPTSIGLASGVTAFVLNASAILADVRIIWS